MFILYPSNPLDFKTPDETYQEEYEAMASTGCTVALFSFEDFEAGTLKTRPNISAGEKVLYRGWMMNPASYSNLTARFHSRNLLAFTTAEEYRLCHHLPQWYPQLSGLTSETVFLASDADFSKELAGFNWPGYFIKDFVKSLSIADRSRAVYVSGVEKNISKTPSNAILCFGAKPIQLLAIFRKSLKNART